MKIYERCNRCANHNGEKCTEDAFACAPFASNPSERYQLFMARTCDNYSEEKSCDTCGRGPHNSNKCTEVLCWGANKWTPKEEEKMTDRIERCGNKKCPCGLWVSQNYAGNCKHYSSHTVMNCPAFKPIEKEWVIKVPAGVDFKVMYGALDEPVSLTLLEDHSTNYDSYASKKGIACKLVEKE